MRSSSTASGGPTAEAIVPEPATSAPAAGLLRDAEGRLIRYARISVTDRCNLRCPYCVPCDGEKEHGARGEILTFEEIVRLTRILAAHGVVRVRLTGGEPLLRKGIVDLVRRLRGAVPPVTLCMTTNGTQLRRFAADLHGAGLLRLNASLDTLRADRYRTMTRGGDHARVIGGIEAALSAGFRDLALNAVPIRGHNDDELGALVDWSWERGITPRFIELMPVGEASNLSPEMRMGWREVARILENRILQEGAIRPADHGPAFYLPARDGSDRRVGFVAAVTDGFCDGCNRIRVTARGEVRACLASRRAVSLRDAMRLGLSDEEILGRIAWALGQKGAGHGFGSPEDAEHARVGMSLVGG